ncbi:Holliday junction DNA helicase RuvA [Mesomycoplasma conjunctivae]|uniref:Holliday junction branch migration complex subunit RuvA n=1 Tax=Mesomycoplasma conjunctivae (strain ATCC 25834 / NCTC 10147 / HRC/581) TaxID=572263 RepID=C5J671_MESCH|nr:Holliday junction branch migration protein RuvA [Mesomycoplasma conjunctivae]CAT04963.1 Holliday junction ATP-dependent DNA helicase r [Mesomycoplasma conjunctivae]VEU66131.1 Holliday junction DNA helicase RuvA [Mesomycoplasma conjunctivae]
MQIYKIGKIVSKNKNYLILEQAGNGYLIYTPNIERFNRDEKRKIYVYEFENDYSKITYGFDNFKERILFEDLISIQGIGPKTAMIALNIGWQKIIDYIAAGDWKSLSKIQYISDRNAKQIIFEFQKKYTKLIESAKNQTTTQENNTKQADEVIDEHLMQKTLLEQKTAIELEDTLKILGFQKRQINYALANVEPTESFEHLIEEAIKLISNAREFRN